MRLNFCTKIVVFVIVIKAMVQPLVSIIMPNYNYGRFLEYAINSVLSQTLQNWELIIVDDGSTDNSRRIVEEYIKLDKRIKLYYNEQNMGIAYTCNVGIERAKGKYMLILASDDMLKPKTLENIVKILEKNKNIDVVVLEAEIIDDKGKSLNILFSELHRKPKVKRGNFFRELLKGNFIATGMFRSSLVNKHGIKYDTSLKHLNDWLFWVDLSYVGNFYYYSEPMYLYRVHGRSASCDIHGYIKDEFVLWNLILNKYNLSKKDKSILYYNRVISLLSRKEFNNARQIIFESLRNEICLKNLLLLSVSFPLTFKLAKLIKSLFLIKKEIAKRKIYSIREMEN